MEQSMNDQKNDRSIIYDGVQRPNEYFDNQIRLAWMLKEPYDNPSGQGGGWSYFELFPEGIDDLYDYQFKHRDNPTWHPIIYITFAINNGFLRWNEMEYIRDDRKMCNVVRKTAFINLQKLPARGVTTTFEEDLWEAIGKYSDLLAEQIKLLNPNVLIFGNTMKYYQELFGVDLKSFTEAGSCSYFILEDKLLINAYHPAQKNKGLTRDIYVNDIVQVVKNWKNNQSA